MTAITTPRDDLAALKGRRLHLRAWADEIAAAVEALPPPETYLDAERAARFVMRADQVILAMPVEGETAPADDSYLDAASVIAPARQRLRVYADTLIGRSMALPKPQTYLEGERATRCVLAHDRMLVQLYTPPKAPKYDPLDDLIEDSEDGDDSPEANRRGVDHMLKQMNDATDRYAKFCGYWPDGEPYGEAHRAKMAERSEAGLAWAFKARIDHEAETGQPLSEAEKGDFISLRIAEFMAWQANCIARAFAEATGFWPEDERGDGTIPRGNPYKPSDPDPFAVKADYLTWRGKHVSFYGPDLLPGERRGPTDYPCFIIRLDPPPDSG